MEGAQSGDLSGPAFTGGERAAVAFAEAMHQRPHDVPADVLGEVRRVFNDAEFVELGYVVAQFIGMGQFVHLLGVPNPSVAPAD